MGEAKHALKGMEGGKWVWSPTAPGNGTTVATFVCNAHVGCGRMLKAKKIDCTFVLMCKGVHSTEMKLKRRANSTLDAADEDALRFSLDSGGKPAGVLVALTKKEMAKLKAEGKRPEDHKEDEGGLTGEHCSFPQSTIHKPACVSCTYYACSMTYLNMTVSEHVSCMYPDMYHACILTCIDMYHRYTYCSCIPHVSCMYPACITHVLRHVSTRIADTHIPHVSRMYPACITPCITMYPDMYPTCIRILTYSLRILSRNDCIPYRFGDVFDSCAQVLQLWPTFRTVQGR
jgi:hypothetical protein